MICHRKERFDYTDPECLRCKERFNCFVQRHNRPDQQAPPSQATVTGHSNVQLPSRPFIYCEKAPPRDVVEAAGLVYSIGLKLEYERHQPVSAMRKPVPESESHQVKAAPLPPWADRLYETACEHGIGWTKYYVCHLCGGRIVVTIINPTKDKRLRQPNVVVQIDYAEKSGPRTSHYFASEPRFIGSLDFQVKGERQQSFKLSPAGAEKTLKDLAKTLEEGQYRDTQHLFPPNTFEGPDLDQLRMPGLDLSDCVNAKRGPYKFIIEKRPGPGRPGVLMRCTSENEAGTLLLAEKFYSEHDLITGKNVRELWTEFVDGIVPRICESKFAHNCEGAVKECSFQSKDGSAAKDYLLCERAIEMHQKRGNKIQIKPVGEESAKVEEKPNKNGDIFNLVRNKPKRQELVERAKDSFKRFREHLNAAILAQLDKDVRSIKSELIDDYEYSIAHDPGRVIVMQAVFVHPKSGTRFLVATRNINERDALVPEFNLKQEWQKFIDDNRPRPVCTSILEHNCTGQVVPCWFTDANDRPLGDLRQFCETAIAMHLARGSLIKRLPPGDAPNERAKQMIEPLYYDDSDQAPLMQSYRDRDSHACPLMKASCGVARQKLSGEFCRTCNVGRLPPK